MTSCLFFSLAHRFLRTSSSTPLDQSGGSGSASTSLSHSVALLLAVGVTVPTSCVRVAVTVSKELLGLSRLLQRQSSRLHHVMKTHTDRQRTMRLVISGCNTVLCDKVQSLSISINETRQVPDYRTFWILRWYPY
jgi:hypothetical protein